MISLQEVQELSNHYSVIPIIKPVFGGTETPLGIYEKVCGSNPNTFLLESAEQGVWGRYSFIGLSSRGQLIADSAGVRWNSEHFATPDGKPLSEKPLDALRQLQESWKSSPTADFPLSSGLVGFASWEVVSEIEKFGDLKRSDYQIPMLCFTQFDLVIVVDHKSAELLLVSLIFVDGESSISSKYENALSRLTVLERELSLPTQQQYRVPLWPDPKPEQNTTKTEFLDSVNAAKHHVVQGDVFQVVISQRFDHECTADASEVYQALRAMNPSPYMYLTRWADESGEFAIVGSSPEALVKVSDGRVITHPIAGSRPRGEDTQADLALSDELLADAKEQSEHLMLVDLARNDLLKVCKPESLVVSEFMEIHRFSHIMHMVSTVEGEIRDGFGPVDAFVATFPAGTLSGAPKPRAIEIIHDLEKSGRGLFGGVVGYFDYQGNSDLAIAIRTAVIRDSVAHVQAGAGIVLDSIPETEYAETQSKAAVVLRAVAAANAMSR